MSSKKRSKWGVFYNRIPNQGHMVYTSLDELVEPQVAVAVCLGRFTPMAACSAVIIKSDRLEAYDWHPPQLQLVNRTRFSGPVVEAHRIHGFSEGLDALLVAFGNSLYSTLLYSTMSNSFVTCSLHQYDLDKYGYEQGEPELAIKQWAASEPSGRCCALRVYREYMAIIPFECIEGTTERLPSFVTKFNEVDSRLHNVLSWCFLEGYMEPTLGLLMEGSGRPAWVGRAVGNKKDSKSFAIVAIDLRLQSFSLIHYQEGLPNDLAALYACQKPVGGCFAVGISSLLHLEQGSGGCGFAMNSYAFKLSDYRFLPILNALECTVEHAQIIHVAADLFWMCLTDGRRLTIKVSKGSRYVNNISISWQPESIADHFPLTSFSVYNGLLLLGSDCADTLLYQLSSVPSGTQQPKHKEQTLEYFDENELYLAEMELEEKQLSDKANVLLLDRLTSTGSMSSACCALLSGNPERPVSQKTPKAMIGVGGRGKSAPYIAVRSPHLPIKEAARFPVPGATAAFAVGDADSRFILVSTPTTTLVLQMTSGEMLQEVEEGEFFLEGSTITAGTIDDMIVQVRAGGIRLLKGIKRVHEEAYSGRFLKAQIFQNFVIALDSQSKDVVHRIDGDGVKLVHSGSDCVTSGMFEFNQTVLYYRLTRSGLLEISDGTNCVFSNNLIGLLPNVVEPDGHHGAQIVVPDLLCMVSHNDSVHVVVASKGILAVYSNMSRSLKFFKVEARATKSTSMYPLTINSSTFGVVVQTPLRKLIVHIGIRNYPRIHSLLGNIIHVSRLNEDRLLMVDKSFRVRLASLDTRFDIDRSDCCLFKRMIEKDVVLEPRKIVFLPPVNAFVVACRTPSSFKLPADEYSTDADHPDFEYPPGAPCPTSYRYSLHVLSPISWTLTDSVSIPDQPSCSEYDAIVDVRVCVLSTKSAQAGRKPFIVVGISSLRGEDRPVRGRALVFDVTEVVPEPGRPETNRRLRLLCSSDVKTTLGAICELKGAVLVSQGARIIVHGFENDDTLQGCAFVDSAIFSSSAASLSSLFALGDVQRGVSLYAYQEEPPRIAQIARCLDYATGRVSVTSVEFLPVHEDALVVSGDQARNLYLHSYSPKHPRSLNGMRLILRGGMRLTSCVSAMQRVVDRVYLFLQDGSVFILSSVPQAEFKRASAILARTFSAFSLPGGLHPKAARAMAIPSCPDPGIVVPRTIMDRSFLEERTLKHASIPQLRLVASSVIVDWDQARADLERKEH